MSRCLRIGLDVYLGNFSARFASYLKVELTTSQTANLLNVGRRELAVSMIEERDKVRWDRM